MTPRKTRTPTATTKCTTARTVAALLAALVVGTTGVSRAAPAGREKTSWFPPPRPAWGQAATPAESAILALLEAYRVALEQKDVEAVAATHVEINAEQRAGFERYFASADGLGVVISDVDVLVEGDEALVTFTRRDSFRDHKSGKELQLELRLSSEAVQRDGRWLLGGGKRL
jgi:ketosteroid isomerase-like protein